MNVGVSERIKASVREQALTMGRRIDLHLTENMPMLIDKHDLATRKDNVDIDRKMSQYEGTLDDLEIWKENTTGRVASIKKRVINLESKYGLPKEGGK